MFVTLCYLEELISLSYHNLTDSMKYAIQYDVVRILRGIRMYRVPTGESKNIMLICQSKADLDDKKFSFVKSYLINTEQNRTIHHFN